MIESKEVGVDGAVEANEYVSLALGEMTCLGVLALT